jgi:hypothetical protein
MLNWPDFDVQAAITKMSAAHRGKASVCAGILTATKNGRNCI